VDPGIHGSCRRRASPLLVSRSTPRTPVVRRGRHPVQMHGFAGGRQLVARLPSGWRPHRAVVQRSPDTARFGHVPGHLLAAGARQDSRRGLSTSSGWGVQPTASASIVPAAPTPTAPAAPGRTPVTRGSEPPPPFTRWGRFRRHVSSQSSGRRAVACEDRTDLARADLRILGCGGFNTADGA